MDVLYSDKLLENISTPYLSLRRLTQLNYHQIQFGVSKQISLSHSIRPLTSSALMTALNLVTGVSKNGSHRNLPNSAESSAGSRVGRASDRAHTNSAWEPNFRLEAVRLPLEYATLLLNRSLCQIENEFTAFSSHLRTMLPESSSQPLPTKWPIHAI